MLKEIFVTSLMGLPIALPLGMLTFAAARRCLKKGWRKLCVLVLGILAVGIGYGALRFGGVIVFPGDNGYSANWFDASYRDDGFRYIYGCGTFAAGIAAAFRSKKKAAEKKPMMKE